MPTNSIVGLPDTIVVPDGFSTSRTISRASSSSTTSPTSSITSSAHISEGPAPGAFSSSSPSLTSSPATETTAASAQVTAAAQPQATPVGSIAGLVIGLLLLVGLILFGVRWFFIRKRDHKTTPARSRISRLNISGPTGFQHLQSGAHTLGDGSAAQMATPASSARPTATAEANAAAASPYDRIKQKYSFDLNQLETGLSSHMETMKTSRKNAPSH